MSAPSTAIQTYLSAWSLSSMPVFQRTLDALRSARVQSGGSPGALAGIVTRDPLMTLQLLAYANSLPRGSFAAEIASAEHAIMLIGAERFYERFSRRPTLETLLASDPARLAACYWKWSAIQLSAVLQREIVRVRLDNRAEEVTIATLLHDVVELLLLWSHPKAVPELTLFTRQSDLVKDPDRQRHRLGATYAELMTAIGDAWKLPSLLRALVEDSQGEGPRVVSIELARRIAREAMSGWHGETLHGAVRELADFLHQPVDDMWRRVVELALRQARQADAPWPPAARWLAMRPGRWPPEPLPDEAGLATQGDGMDDEALQAASRQLRAAIGRGLEAEQVMTLLFRGLRLGLGLQRLGFLACGEGTARASMMAGLPNDHALRGWNRSPEEIPLFARLLTKTQSLACAATNRPAVGALLPDALQGLADQDFFVMSLHLHNRPLGIVYADGGSVLPSLDQIRYQRFKALSLAALAALSATPGPTQ